MPGPQEHYRSLRPKLQDLAKPPYSTRRRAHSLTDEGQCSRADLLATLADPLPWSPIIKALVAHQLSIRSVEWLPKGLSLWQSGALAERSSSPLAASDVLRVPGASAWS